MKYTARARGFAGVLALLASGTTLGQTTLPNTFAEGQPALATEVNENFTALRDGINDLESNELIGLNPATFDGSVIAWEEGQSTWINQRLSTGNTGGGVSFSQRGPYTAISCIIALQGIYPSRSQADPFIGQISWFGGTFAPRGWSFCDGQILAIAPNTALFSLIGTIYGGDGRVTFALPDLRGRAPIHQGSGPGLSTYRLGQKGGLETQTLTINQLPSHSHSVLVTPEQLP